jgi:hypothetical protein
MGTAVVSANRQGNAAGGNSKRQFRSGALEIDVPAVAMQGFLEALSRVAVRGPVIPGKVKVEASDDYPWWNIDIEEADDCSAGRCVPSRALRLSSPPTGSRPAPWFVWSAERPVEVDPAGPGAACEGLVPHLRYEALQALIR